MQKLSLKDVNPNLREFYTRALDGSRRKDFDYAISLLKAVVQKAPAFGEARDKLRELELAKLEASGGPGITVAFRNMFHVGKIRKQVETAPLQALALCEEELGHCINNPTVLKLMIEAAEKVEARFITIEVLELLVKFNPRANEQIERLVACYQEESRLDDVVKLYQALTLQAPGDLDLQGKLREATQAAGREKGRQAEAAERESVTLQLEDNIIRDPSQARVVIERYNQMLRDNDSIDIRRKLANAYMVAGEFEQAARELEHVAKAMGAMDPQLDKLIEKAYLAKIDQNIGLLKSNPQAYENSEEQLAQFVEYRKNFRFERARKRLEAYPKDALLHQDLAQLYFEFADYEEAIAEFEQSAGNIQRRAHARIGIARCQVKLRRLEEAIESFNTGLSEIIRADRFKLEAMYELAQCHEHLGESDKALEIFREIQRNNVKFKDVKAQVERLSGSAQ